MKNIEEKPHAQAPYFREMKSKALILPEVSFLLMIQIFDDTVNYFRSLAAFLNFLSHLKYCVKLFDICEE